MPAVGQSEERSAWHIEALHTAALVKHLLARSFLVLAGLLLLVGCSSEAESQEPSDPAEVIKGYVAAYNAHDIDRAMKYFADDAVYVQGTDRFEGAVAIRAEVLLEFEVHAPGGDAYSISNLVVDGDTVS